MRNFWGLVTVKPANSLWATIGFFAQASLSSNWLWKSNTVVLSSYPSFTRTFTHQFTVFNGWCSQLIPTIHRLNGVNNKFFKER